VLSLGEKLFEPFFRERNGVRRGDADGGEAVRARGVDERGLDRVRIGQKSRST
jgi:hypothetical protein